MIIHTHMHLWLWGKVRGPHRLESRAMVDDWGNNLTFSLRHDGMEWLDMPVKPGATPEEMEALVNLMVSLVTPSKGNT